MLIAKFAEGIIYGCPSHRKAVKLTPWWEIAADTKHLRSDLSGLRIIDGHVWKACDGSLEPCCSRHEQGARVFPQCHINHGLSGSSGFFPTSSDGLPFACRATSKYLHSPQDHD